MCHLTSLQTVTKTNEKPLPVENFVTETGRERNELTMVERTTNTHELDNVVERACRGKARSQVAG